MKNIIFGDIVIDAGDELLPAIRVHSFNSNFLLTDDGTPKTAKLYLDKRFGSYCLFKKGRDALYVALQSYNLTKEDYVTILTTSGNFYVSKCVTREIEKFCKWNREVTDKTKIIIFVHEFGFPCRNMKKVAKYGLPIIEDCAHTFYDTDSEIGRYSDYVVYSLPKAFPMQMGGLLKTNKPLNVETNPAIEQYVLNNLSRHIDKIKEYVEKRKKNQKYLWDNLKDIGIRPFFTDDKAVPGTFLFHWDARIDFPKLKEFMYLNGVECSVFYGQDAFFIPVHQELKRSELKYMVELLHFFKQYGYEV